MRAIIVSGYPEFVGMLVDVYYADPLYDEGTGKIIPLYRTVPTMYLQGIKCLFQQQHLSFFPPAKNADESTNLLVTA
jgi:hypothetical protein